VTLRVALNATAYDDGPSGAKERAIGLAAGLLQEGVHVLLCAPAGTSFAPLVEAELGGTGADPPAARLEEVETPLVPSRPARRALKSARWFESNLPSDVDLFVTDYYPVLERVPTALTVHDLRYLAAPEHEPAARVAWFKAFYARLARRAPLVVVPSRAIATQAVELLGVDPGRVFVVPNGLSRAWRDAPREPLPAEHFLMVGAAEPRKDVRTAIAALRVAGDPRGTVLPLRIVGRRGPGLEAALSAGEVVDVRGVVGDEELVRLCRAAAALVHPSRYEGFGLPVIQALAVGVPVVAANCAAVEEVADGGAELLPPVDVERWAAALARITAHRGRPRARGDATERAREFTWRAAARALLAARSDRLLAGADAHDGGDAPDERRQEREAADPDQ
jgi:alpha-1,3-rhamnosyl/mannosyltransferase